MRLRGFVEVHKHVDPGTVVQIRHSNIVVVTQEGDKVMGSCYLEYESNGGGTLSLRVSESYETVIARINNAQELD